jgi:RHS repeat-associated protein
VQLADLDGDGAIDLVTKSGISDFRFLPGKDATHFGSAVAIGTVPNFTFEDPDVRLGDFDGDRRTDVAITTSAGLAIGYNLGGKDWAIPKTVGKIDDKQPLLFSDGKTQLCDVNGDRVLDFCYLRSGALTYWLGRGRGAFELAVEASGVPAFDVSDPWRLIDLNGDGWVDLVHVGVTEVDYVLATAAGTFGASAIIKNTPEKLATTTIDFADMNGSGTTDVVWVDVSGDASQAWRYLEIFPNGRGGLLNSIDNGLGKVTTISYAPAALSAAAARDAGKPWTTRMNVAMPVVQTITVDSSLGDPPLKTEYSYRDGTWDPQDRTFAGFGGGIQTELGDQYTPTLLSENTFDTGLTTRTLRGSVLTAEQRDEHGYLFSRSTNAYASMTLATARDGRAVEYAYNSSNLVEHIEGSDPSNERLTFSESVQDNYGNVLEERRWGEISGKNFLVGNDEAITVRTFANNTDDWILGHLATEELQDTAGNRVSAHRVYYDGKPFQGLALGQIARGDLTRQEEWIGPDPDKYRLETATKFNADGQPIETKDARGGGRLFQWDPDDRTTIKSEQVKLETAVDLTEIAEIDPRFGDLLSVTEYNGQVTRFQYDALGRLTGVVKPGDTSDQPSINYSYLPGAPLSRVVTESRVSSGPDQIERTEAVFDGLGRKRASLTRDEKERWVMAGVGLLDARGQARRALRPRFVTAADVASPPISKDALGTSSWRDASGRSVRTLTQAGIESKTQYQPLLTLSWDGGQTDSASRYEHLPTEHATDGLGRAVRATQYLNGKPVSSTFTYDAAGRLRSRTDPEGNVARYQYDGAGQRTLIDDPDLGKRSFVYDETGNLIERHNPDRSVLKYTFDLAGRSLTEDWDGDGKPEVVRHWDALRSAPDNLLFRGKLAFTDEPTGSTEHEYDARGRITNSTVTIDGKPYASGSRFDNLDRESLHIYPDGSSIKIQRNPRGQLSGYGDNAVQFDFDGDGLQTRMRFNTGVTQLYGYDDDRRLTELTATAADKTTIERLKWDFDSAGNIATLTDLRPNVAPTEDRSESYTYDNFYRLRAAQGTWGKTAWTYSPSGNLTARTSTIAAQNVTSLGYGKNAGPHAMTALNARTITYDVLGRMLSDGNRTYTWNSADQLTDVAAANGGSAQNRFDADGIRRVRVEKNADGSTDTVHFISPWSEVRNGKLVRYIVHTERRIARLSDTNGTASAEAAPLGDGDAEPPLFLRVLAQLGQLALTLALVTALAWTQRERIARAFAVTMPVACLLVLVGCGSDKGGPSALPVEDGTVQTLSASDTLLINDQLGSLLSETDGAGAQPTRFAAYPYGVTRYGGSKETRQYANAPRDRGVGLDLMGARFYAADLGVWTIADPVLINGPEKATSEQFATANPYAYSNLDPVIAVDSDGNFWHIIVGAVIGAVVGGGIEAARQYIATGKVDDWGRVGAAAAGGLVSGAIQTALPGVGTAAVLGYGGLSGAAGGMAERLVASGGKSAGSVKDVLIDTGVGIATAGVIKGGSAVFRKAAGALRAPGAKAISEVAKEIPHGFTGPEQFGAAKSDLHAALAQHGVTDAQVGVRGSAVTGVGFKSGKAFGPHSDIDFFVESDQLVSGLPTSQKVPGMVKPEVLMDKFPALQSWSDRWSETLGREVSPAGFGKGSVPEGPQIR